MGRENEALRREREILREAAALGPAALLYAKMDEGWAGRLEGAADKIAAERAAKAAPELLAACKRALPWVCKLLADAGHLGCVGRRDAERTADLLRRAIDAAEGGAT